MVVVLLPPKMRVYHYHGSISAIAAPISASTSGAVVDRPCLRKARALARRTTTLARQQAYTAGFSLLLLLSLLPWVREAVAGGIYAAASSPPISTTASFASAGCCPSFVMSAAALTVSVPVESNIASDRPEMAVVAEILELVSENVSCAWFCVELRPRSK